MGHFKHANAQRLTRRLFEKYGYLKELFALDEEGCIQPLYQPPNVPSCFRDQYEWATRRYAGYCIFFQVGRFCEFYGEQAQRYGRFFGLELRPKGRMTGLYCGFPLRLLQGFKKRAYQAGMSYVVVGERDYYPSGLKKRVITELVSFNHKTTTPESPPTVIPATFLSGNLV